MYTHWGGYDLPIILQDALKRQKRWSDTSYLTRIIFCKMVKNHIEEETGYGISTILTDNNNPIIEVNIENQTVSFNNITWNFKKYINLSTKQIRNVYNK